jgi:hypothetical protein
LAVGTGDTSEALASAAREALGDQDTVQHRRLRPTAREERSGIRLDFTGARRGTYVVEASTDLSHWAGIGVAREVADGTFEFDDPHTNQFPCRYYRIVEP